MKRVIITGGTGLVGMALAESLAKDEYDVVLLSRSPEKHAAKLRKGVRAERWDAQSAENWGHLADGAEAIVNFAGESIAGRRLIPARWTADYKRRIRDSRLKAGEAVVAAVTAARQKPKLVVQQSAVGYYGPHNDEVLDEKTPAGDDFLAKIAIAWEKSTLPVEAQGVRRVIPRTGVRLLNAPGGFLRPLVLIFNLMIGGPMGSGRQYWPWIHPADEVRALRFLIDNDQASGPFNMTAPNPATNREFAQAFGRVVHRPAIVPAPAFALRLVLGELADALILQSQRAVPKRLLEMGFQFKYAELEAALRDAVAR
jgi:uncharacterized protein (TIGR01777 family)